MTRTIGEAIEGRLHNLGLRQKDLADSIGVPVSTLNSWLRLGRDIPAQYILKIAHVLRCTPTNLLSGGEDDRETPTKSDAIEDLIRATVAEVLRQQEAQKRRGDTEPQMRTATYIERQREQLEQIRAEQAAEHGDPIRAMFYRMGAELLGDEITATPAQTPASTQAHTPVQTCLRPAALRREAAPSQRPGICSRHNRRQLQRLGAHRKNRNPCDHPLMGIVTQTGQGGKGMRRIKTYKKWSIWRLTAAEANDGGGRFAAFLPETDPGAMDEPEWAADSVQELIDFIDSYET